MSGWPTQLYGVPERDASSVPLAGLDLEPGEDLFGEVGAAGPGELAGEGELPVEGGDGEEEEGGDGPASLPGWALTGCGRIHDFGPRPPVLRHGGRLRSGVHGGACRRIRRGR